MSNALKYFVWLCTNSHQPIVAVEVAKGIVMLNDNATKRVLNVCVPPPFEGCRIPFETMFQRTRLAFGRGECYEMLLRSGAKVVFDHDVCYFRVYGYYQDHADVYTMMRLAHIDYIPYEKVQHMEGLEILAD